MATDIDTSGMRALRHRSMRAIRSTIAVLMLVSVVSSPATAQAPTLRRNGAATQLFVDGKPFIILGGELFNATASSTTALAPVLDRLAAAHVNTVLAPVAWDQLEPDEGRFDFAAVDGLLHAAAQRDLRVVILWLGAFKNARSTYAPTWVRADRRLFPRAMLTGPEPASGAMAVTPAPVLSLFSPALVEADSRAFAALLRHLTAIDRDHRVIMVQVENETGLLGDSRDRSPGAIAAWNGPVPRALTDRLTALEPGIAATWAAAGRRRSGSWAELFGRSPAADEIFMAWSFARYVERVAAAGRAVSTLPFYTNAWLGPQPGQPDPGNYPSGGPTARMLDVWKVGAPTLALLAPDIYVDGAREVQRAYARPDNPLFIPEERLRAGDLFWALGRHRAIGQATFGIDAIRPQSQLAQAYALLTPMLGIVADAQADDRIAGVLIEGDETQVIDLGGLTLTVRGADAFWAKVRLDAGQQAPPPPPPPPSEIDGAAVAPDPRPYGLIIATAPGEYVVVGRGFILDASRNGAPVELDRIEEGVFADGRWVGGRWLNGDEYGQVVPRVALRAAKVRFLP